MVRMSDLVRGIARDPAPPARPSGGSTRPAGVPAAPASEPVTMARLVTESPAAHREPVADTPAEPVAPLLADLQRTLVEVHHLLRAGTALPWATLQDCVDRATAALLGSADLFWLANNPSAPPGSDYVACHQARVGVMALRVAIGAGYDRARLASLGLAACLFDVGLWQLPEGLLSRLDALTDAEMAAYRSHPTVSAELVQRWGPPRDGIVPAILDHHEREHGRGFPRGVRGDAIHPDAKVIGLAETYASLTMPPASRPRLRPHEAIREIVRARHDEFSPALVKALLAEVSVFPPGTIVKLSTEEIGRVVAVNRNHPLRPRVEVLADGRGQRLPSPKLIDLSEAPFLYITGPVGETGR